jgi:hypothetical protein
VTKYLDLFWSGARVLTSTATYSSAWSRSDLLYRVVWTVVSANST